MHPRLGIPGLMRYILGANVALYLLSRFSAGSLSFLALDASAVLRGEIWRIFTYVLINTSSKPLWLLASCIFYYWLGESLERMWGSTKFTVYYVSGTLLTALAVILGYFIDGSNYTVYGATYVNSALFLAYAMYNPEARVYLMYILPVKLKWLAWAELAVYGINIFSATFAGRWGLAMMPVIAMLNLLVFFAPSFQQRIDRTRAQHRPEAIQFRRAVQEQQKPKGYNHKCCVCGKTDTEYPNMQFRYCSKCEGYHCYCEEHIFNHVHRTE